MTNASNAPVLLATDLSARGDRALDRALQLARQWQAPLVIVTVQPSPGSEEVTNDVVGKPSWSTQSNAQRAERRLRRDLDEQASGVEVHIRIEHGPAARRVLQVAEELGCRLIVVGPARNPAFEPLTLGSTVTWLTRHSPIPLLLVHERVRGPYRSLAAASDFSASAQQALESATGLFGTPLKLALVHGLEMPRAGLLVGQHDTQIDQARARTRQQALTWLTEAGLSSGQGWQAELVIEAGDPARLMRDYALDHDVDLVVVGTHGRSALFDLLIGSMALRLLEQVQTDTLLVRDERARHPIEPE